MTGHIVPMGAGKAVMDRRNDPLHDYVLAHRQGRPDGALRRHRDR